MPAATEEQLRVAADHLTVTGTILVSTEAGEHKSHLTLKNGSPYPVHVVRIDVGAQTTPLDLWVSANGSSDAIVTARAELFTAFQPGTNAIAVYVFVDGVKFGVSVPTVKFEWSGYPILAAVSPSCGFWMQNAPVSESRWSYTPTDDRKFTLKVPTGFKVRSENGSIFASPVSTSVPTAGTVILIDQAGVVVGHIGLRVQAQVPAPAGTALTPGSIPGRG